MSVKKFVLLAALGLVAVMAIGAMTASATVVTCGAGIHCSSGQTFNGFSSNAQFTTADGASTCAASYIKGKLTGSSTSAGAVAGQLTDVDLGSCTDHIANCTIASTNAALGVSYGATFTATSLTVSNWSLTMSMMCFGVQVTCVYSVANMSGNISGSIVTYNAPLSLSSGFGCSTNATLDVTYTLRSGTTVGSGTLMTVDA